MTEEEYYEQEERMAEDRHYAELAAQDGYIQEIGCAKQFLESNGFIVTEQAAQLPKVEEVTVEELVLLFESKLSVGSYDGAEAAAWAIAKCYPAGIKIIPTEHGR